MDADQPTNLDPLVVGKDFAQLIQSPADMALAERQKVFQSNWLFLVLAGGSFDIILSNSARFNSSTALSNIFLGRSVGSFLTLRPTSLLADLRLSPLVLGLGQHRCIRFPEGSRTIIACRFAALLNFYSGIVWIHSSIWRLEVDAISSPP
ncbi:hypothetical protein B0H13DRAFT_1931375 [Mycena leptocephala]|nr:hypothetical protein B0H13DRAFT_1931375 [Mycena leptocephala]